MVVSKTIRNKYYLEIVDMCDYVNEAYPISKHYKINKQAGDSKFYIFGAIKAAYDDKLIATIQWSDVFDKLYLTTAGDSLQTDVVTYDDYKDFVYLLDEAWDQLTDLFVEKDA